MDWFRAWAGLSTDPKYLVVMRSTGADGAQVLGIWVALMDHASQARPRGSIEHFDLETYSAFAGIDPERVRSVVAALGPDGPLSRPLHDGARLASWETRQPANSDSTAAERQRRHRAKKKAQKASPKPGEPANPTHPVTDGHARDSVTVTGHEAEEKQSFSDASRQAPSFDTSLGNISQHARAMNAGEVWSALEAAGIRIPFLRRHFQAAHVASWVNAGITGEQLAESIRRAAAARDRAQDARPINLGFLEAFVTEVRSGLPAKSTTRSTGHGRVDAAAAEFLAGP